MFQWFTENHLRDNAWIEKPKKGSASNEAPPLVHCALAVSEITVLNAGTLPSIFFVTRFAEGFTGSIKAAVVHKVSHQDHRLFQSGHDITPR